ncbi:MAG: hypothetical protein PWP66_147 [Thermosediminibacterales bacterium]|nr:hypothetical protein [Thermosediminibacterales bacterium]MDK2901542.1 hypothetical protein [Thermosediminibacterales bacterium]
MLTKIYAEVCVNIPALKTNKPYHYSIPENIKDILSPGHKVLVPFGNTNAEGYVVGFTEKAEVEDVKGILKIIDRQIVIPAPLIELAKWMSRRYLCPLAKILECIAPSGIKTRTSQIITLRHEKLNDKFMQDIQCYAPLQWRIINLLKNSEKGLLEYKTLKRELKNKNIYSSLRKLEEKGIVHIDKQEKTGVKRKLVKSATLLYDSSVMDFGTICDEYGIKSSIQKKILKEILNRKEISLVELSTILGISYSGVYSSAKALEKRNIIKLENKEIRRDPYMKPYENPANLTPTDEQKNVLELIDECLERVNGQKILVHGVTGSGKTEIYLRAVEKILNMGKGAIVLVPEISLASQIVESFKNRFGDLVAVLHSRLSAGERYDEWRRILDSEARVVVGARSAVFAPVKDLGIIVIDEEHENTYKQEEDPKYHAREVAEKRIELEKGLLVLGSATPSIETYYKGKRGEYIITNLKKRVNNRPMPVVELIDMRKELKSNNKSIFSRRLHSCIKQALKNNEQIILFLNRRGFSTFILCRDCGFVMKCPHCDISLTYHFDTKDLKCHYCGFEKKVPDFCPHCKGSAIRYFGIGTQRIEQEIKKFFPDCRILRMDMDNTRKKGAHERILETFKKRKADILIGTQMITKGLDFPGVSLVGVITADTSLNLPDFRAGERTFQLVMQVAGRAGRGDVPGRVIVQTYNPRHYSLQHAVNCDYKNFYAKEIILRERFNYPPFSEMANITIKSQEEEKVKVCAIQLGAVIKEKFAKLWCIMGPSPAPIYKLRDKYRWQITIKGKSLDGLEPLLEFKRGIIEKYSNVSIDIDINPIFSL